MNEKNPLKSDLGAAILRTLTHFAEKVKGLEGLNDLYRQCAPGGEAGFFSRVLTALDMNVESLERLRARALPAAALIIMAAFPASPLDRPGPARLPGAPAQRCRAVLAPKELGWVPGSPRPHDPPQSLPPWLGARTSPPSARSLPTRGAGRWRPAALPLARKAFPPCSAASRAEPGPGSPPCSCASAARPCFLALVDGTQRRWPARRPLHGSQDPGSGAGPGPEARAPFRLR